METASERFDRKWMPEPNSGCFLWLGAVHKTAGYGSFKKPGERVMTAAHRFAYERASGPIPKGLLVCHRCNTPACVNPAHLYAGTHKDNTDDARRAGRLRGAAFGSQPPNTRLTAEDVSQIRCLARQGISQSKIASQFGIAQTNVSAIVLRKNWKHVS